MAKSKSSTRKRPFYSKVKDPVKPMWMQVVRFITITLCSIIMLLAMAAIVLKYYLLVSKH